MLFRIMFSRFLKPVMFPMYHTTSPFLFKESYTHTHMNLQQQKKEKKPRISCVEIFLYFCDRFVTDLNIYKNRHMMLLL